MNDRPPNIINCKEHLTSSGQGDLLGLASPLGKISGLTRIGIHYEILSPGHRTSFPHAESSEEEFVYVVSGLPSVWLNGDLFDLAPGDAVGFPAGTGIAHTFLNNSLEDAHLLVIGEATKPDNKVFYPLDPDQQSIMNAKGIGWVDPPAHRLGLHNGKAERGSR